MPTKQSVEQLELRRKPRPNTVATKTPRESRSQAAILQRQQRIVVQRDAQHLTWTEIAGLHRTSERVVRESYWRYIQEVGPIIAGEQPAAIAVSYLRMLEGQRQQIAQIGEAASTPMEKLAAAKAVVGVIEKEIDLRQRIGLLPRDLADLPRMENLGFLLDAVVAKLRELGAGPEVFEELHAIMSGRLQEIEDPQTLQPLSG
jgi:hypothetical protein